MSDRGGNVVLSCQNLSKFYVQGKRRIDVICGVNLELRAAERVAILGRSGSGKSTLLHLLAGLDTPDEGSVEVGGVEMSAADNNARAAIRCTDMGFVYQNHHLLPEFTALENIAMPLRIAGNRKHQAEAAAVELLADVGLADRATHLPSELSGGERQRVAVARALAGRPKVVLADEPTGNLDEENAVHVMNLLRALSESHATAFLVVTHDTSMLGIFDRVLKLESGTISAQEANLSV
ncbi:MAG: ABC transporter ATP-binding protein [Gammaproteobacteria bacterium]|nr:ABC transporter ATP-binding protein [Gammaproteobacteria bacterium]